VHHGNGTQHIFDSRADVLFVSTHQWPLWPGSGASSEHGEGAGRGFTINLPLPPGFDDAGYAAVFQNIVIPLAEQYQPQLTLVSAGFDAHGDDPLANMAMTEKGFARLCAMVLEIAQRHGAGRLVLTLEGGYNLEALARSVRACMAVMAGEPAAAPGPIPTIGLLAPAAQAVIDGLRASLPTRWRL